MQIAYLTAGAAGMFCGSCMHDNTLVAELIAQGHEALLVPLYTPIRTDEKDVSQKRIFFGGINVFLQEKIPLFRYTPRFLDRLLDQPALLRWVSRYAVRTEAEQLGKLTISMLQGEHGHQRKEVDRLVEWLGSEVKPQVIHLTNALLSGVVHEIKRRLGIPVVCTLQGDDIFLEALPPEFRSKALDAIHRNSEQIDGFLSTSHYYADFMSGYLRVPRQKIFCIHPGLNLTGHHPDAPVRSEQRPPVIGYFARVAPEKGLHQLAEAFQLLCKSEPGLACRLHVSGWLGEQNLAYFEQIQRRLADAGLSDRFQYQESPDHESKVRFLRELDVLSVPTTYREPKGLYVLEALANGIPVVQPRHGSFPELIDATGGGVLVSPDDPSDLARALAEVLRDRARLGEIGTRGQRKVWEHFTAEREARETVAYYQQFLQQP